ncbi:MAG: Fis family transcriptional regulator [Gammaproteobacteria bacterium]|nr:Fis family transcriptional regulator [Gammaproteobacteria bacterium]
MKKTDKKIENSIINALNQVCNIALDEVAGFKWLTHWVNYNNFPQSFSIVCVFDTKQDLNNALTNQDDDYLYRLIKDKLATANIKIKDIKRIVSFDSEQACQIENDGNWNRRFNNR